MSPSTVDVPEDPHLPPRPVAPGDGECCRSDCANCVFTVYERDLERWEARAEMVRQLRGSASAAAAAAKG